MKKLYFPLAVLALAGLAACTSSPRSSGTNLLSPGTLSLVQNAVFEVVWEKPAEDPTVYEKKLIGTGFLIISGTTNTIPSERRSRFPKPS